MKIEICQTCKVQEMNEICWYDEHLTDLQVYWCKNCGTLLIIDHGEYQWQTCFATNFEMGKGSGDHCRVANNHLKLCQHCRNNAAEPLHTCPYKEDVNHDYTSQCNCCNECKRNCLIDI